MTNINNILRKLNVLNFKKSQNNIKKLIENDRIIIKLFIAENVFVLSILSMIIVFVISNKTIKSFIKIFKII